MFNKSSKNLIVASGLAMALMSLSPSYAAGTTTQSLTDVRQEAQIWTSYVLNPYLRFNGIKASVKDGKVTLTGKVQEDVSKELAKEIAMGVDGIKEVDNQIVVQSDPSDQNEKTNNAYADVVEDATITATVKSKLLWSKYTDGLKTTVATKGGRLTLTGTADSVEAKDLAGLLALNTRGVVSVSNNLVVTAPQSDAKATVTKAAADAEKEFSDAWITAKVKSTLLYSSNVSGTDVHVTTEKGVVMLKGTLSSGAERALAIELARNVLGVKSVDAKGLTF